VGRLDKPILIDRFIDFNQSKTPFLLISISSMTRRLPVFMPSADDRTHSAEVVLWLIWDTGCSWYLRIWKF
jgi:hypothetical protein